MSYGNEMSPADVAAVVRNNDGNGNNGYGGWGGDWSSWIILFLIFGMFGWGGFGGFGGGFGGGADLQGMATRADINEGFALNSLQGSINAIQQGICDSTYALTNGFNNTNMGMMQGFNGVERSLSNRGCMTQLCGKSMNNNRKPLRLGAAFIVLFVVVVS